MKFTIFLLTISLIQVSAGSFGQRVTYSANTVTLKHMFQEITRQTGYDVVYTLDNLNEEKVISVAFNNTPLEKVLEECLKGLPVTYLMEDKTILIKEGERFYDDSAKDSGEAEEQIQQMVIKGRVTDTTGAPLPGVVVMVKGADKGTQTDNKGRYTLKNVPEGAVLQFSLLGFRRLEEPVNRRNTVNVVLRIDIAELQQVEIVSTGYQTISKERSAGSFSKPDMEIIENRSISMNILQRLDGLVPGLAVNNAPSASQNPFLIRGLSTIGIPDPSNPNVLTGTNRNPLYVVDGMPLDDISTINPQDVANITVLKDATAASIWGARASNGVIVITTKKGRTNEKINFQYDGFISFRGRPDLNNRPVLNSRQFIDAASEVFHLQNAANPLRYPVVYPWSTVSGYQGIANTGVAPHEAILYAGFLSETSAAETQARLDSLTLLNNRAQIRDLWYRNALLSNHTLSASGGGKLYSFYGSLTYTHTANNRPHDRDNFFKLNVRQDFRFNNRIQAYLITDLSNTVQTTHRNLTIDNGFYPYQLFQDASGANLSVPYMRYLSDSVRRDFQRRSRIDLDYNPLAEVHLGETKNDALLNRIISGVSLGIVDGLTFEGTYGFVKGNRRTLSFDDEASYLVRSERVQFTVAPTLSAIPQYGLPEIGGRYTEGKESKRNWTVRNQLIYDIQWRNRAHQLTLLAGQESQEQLTLYTASTVRGYDPLLQTYGSIDYKTLSSIGMSGVVMPNSGNRSILIDNAFDTYERRIRFNSYYANGAYTLRDKYTFNASWRIDGSNLFGLNKSAQNKPVWSVGAKWVPSRERFFEVEWVDNLALRATYGITGNAPLPGTASSYDVLNAVSGSALPERRGLAIATAANPKLTWESTQTVNIGVDFSVLNHRLAGAVDVYHKRTDNLLGELPTNSLTGYASIVGNLGTLENKGIEVALATRNIQGGDFHWSTQLAMAYNHNRIVQLNRLTQLTTGSQQVGQQYVEGYSAFAVFAYRYAGLNNQGDPQIYLQDNSITSARNVTTPEDVVFMGTYQPKWSGGITNQFSFHNFRLTVNGIFNLGHVMRRDVNQLYTGRLTHNNMATGGFTTGNVHAEFANRWKEPGDEQFTDIPAYLVNPATSDTRRDVTYYQYADINVLEASYIKLRDITLAYTVPTKICNTLMTESIDLRVQLGNIMLWKANHFDIDPEFHHAFTGTRSLLVQQGTLAFGIHVNF